MPCVQFTGPFHLQGLLANDRTEDAQMRFPVVKQFAD